MHGPSSRSRPVPNNKSTYLETSVINQVLRGVSFTGPVSVYVALYTVMSSDRSQGGTEVLTSGTGYARQLASFSAPTYSGIDGSVQVASLGQIAFPTATSIWGSIVGFGLYDDPTAGHLLYFGLLTGSQNVSVGDTFVFDSGALTVSES